MKKTIRLICMVVMVLCLLLSACSPISYGLTSYKDMHYTRPDMVNFAAVLEESCQAALEEKKIERLEAAILNFYAVYDDFHTNMNLAFIKYCGDLTDIYWEREYRYCTEQSTVAEEGLDRLYRCLAKSPLREVLEGDVYFGADYFLSYEGESIYDLYLMELLEQEAQLQSQYQAIHGQATAVTYYSDAYFTEYGSQMAQIFLELVQLRQEIAAYLGYDSYVDFAYDYYYVRDYSPEQAMSYMADIRAELVPLYKQIARSSFGNYELNACSQGQTLQYVKSMAKAMGGVINEAYSQMEKAQVYDIQYGENKYSVSFETYLTSYNTPYVFLCPTGSVYDKLTFAHEFGHFCCDYATYGGSMQGVDVGEVFSQAMEYLSLTYADDVGQLSQLKMADCLSIYVEQAAYSSFEHQVYGLVGEELTVENIQSLYEDVFTGYGLDTEGWDSRDYVCVTHFYESPLYVISYVLSNDAALQIYELEQEEKGKGLTCYVESMTSAQPYILAFLEETGLQSPFADGRLTRVRMTLEAILQ